MSEAKSFDEWFIEWLNDESVTQHSFMKASWDARQQEIDQLKEENERLNAFGREFIWGEDNPKEYESEMTKLQNQIAQLEAENLKMRNCENCFYTHNPEACEVCNWKLKKDQ